MRDAAATDLLIADLRAIFGTRLRAVVVYGERSAAGAVVDDEAPLHTLASVDSLGYDDLRRCASAAQRWASRGLATPLVLAGDEFARSLDAFPLEYGAIIADHEVVYGADPFERLQVRTDDLRRACEVQAKSHLLHLREAFIECGGREVELPALILASSGSFRALLQHVARLHGDAALDAEALVRFSESLGLVPEVVRAVTTLVPNRTLGPTDAARLFPAYLETAERLARFVDTWST